MTNELLVIENLTPALIFGTDEIDPIIGKIEDEVRSLHFDISTPAGRKGIASLAHKVARSKTALDAMGKSLTDEARKKIGAIDTERRTMRERLDALKEEVRLPLTEWENKEKDRVKAHEGAMETLSLMVDFGVPPSSKDVADRIEKLKAFHAGRTWEEFDVPAQTALETAERKLLEMRDAIAHREAEQAELERLRKENEAREKKEREEKIAREAAEQARKDAEEEARAAAEEVAAKAKAEREEAERKAQAERDEAERQRIEDANKIEAAEQAKKDAEDRTKQAAEDATRIERQRIEDEKAAEATATAKRETDKKHRAKINTEALAAFKEAGLSAADAKRAVEAIAKHQIPNVTINY